MARQHSSGDWRLAIWTVNYSVCRPDALFAGNGHRQSLSRSSQAIWVHKNTPGRTFASEPPASGSRFQWRSLAPVRGERKGPTRKSGPPSTFNESMEMLRARGRGAG